MLKTIQKKKQLPKDFKYLLWSYDFSKINTDKDKERIIINTINYGQWKHWQWLANHYGKQQLKKIIQEIPSSEFRNERALNLISLILGIKKMHYENRNDKIRAKGNFSRA
ncbi:MAG: hypothetical protein HQ539_00065 [Parcubacteria group bacterium]|nr:hypothetical protein [Parcubacteria group bacterium]